MIDAETFMRPCSKCGDKKRHPTEFRRNCNICKACWSAYCSNLRRTATAAARVARGLPEKRYAPSAAQTLFDASVKLAEQHWGPFRTWTKAQHRRHTEFLVQAARKSA